jgi:hypothetical protein
MAEASGTGPTVGGMSWGKVSAAGVGSVGSVGSVLGTGTL